VRHDAYIGKRDTDTAAGAMAKRGATVIAIPVVVMFLVAGLGGERTIFTAIAVIAARQHGNCYQVKGPYDHQPFH